MAFAWRPFLEGFSRELLGDEWLRRRVPAKARSSSWLGFAPAASGQIARLEKRLGVALPTSYRQFLEATNGWRDIGHMVAIRPTSRVAPFREENQDWIDLYMESADEMSLEEHRVYGPEQDCTEFRVELLETAIQISNWGDSAVCLLSPEVRTRSGEWEAWFVANWLPGAVRYRSFRELMQDRRRLARRRLAD